MKHALLAALLLFCALRSNAASYTETTVRPPSLDREFRSVWIATVANIDWPSKPGLSTAQQKAELITLLNRAAELKLNAVIFQVRPACDAMYPSQIEPWSEYLTGAMGKPPEPFYDPLAFALEEAHKRGLELHAWFNPYRALHKSHVGNISPNHISKTHRELVRSYGEYLWLDPGEREVQEYSLRVVMDVVKRYDIDGVQFDDYFYPDPTVNNNRDFPDDASWKKYGLHGKLNRGDWRRENVSAFISRVYSSIKAAKPWVKFGISPPGIWRPGDPPGITGSDNYNKLYADSRKWLVNGWVDYFSPQLYWPIEQKEQSYSALLNWWTQQNTLRRHLWPGLSESGASFNNWKSSEIPDQIRLERKAPGSNGYLIYNATSLLTNSPRGNLLQRELQTNLNAQPALVPASPWLGSNAPAKPNLAVVLSNPIRLQWNAGSTNSVVRWWAVQTRTGTTWKTQIFPGDITSASLTSPPEAVALTAIDRVGNASAPRVLELRKEPAEQRILLKH
jgi:uncharacterized lipoprotein YddW (UPF0748 family)